VCDAGGLQLGNVRVEQVLGNSNRGGTPSQVPFSGFIRLASSLLHFKIARGHHGCRLLCFCVSVMCVARWCAAVWGLSA